MNSGFPEAIRYMEESELWISVEKFKYKVAVSFQNWPANGGNSTIRWCKVFTPYDGGPQEVTNFRFRYEPPVGNSTKEIPGATVEPPPENGMVTVQLVSATGPNRVDIQAKGPFDSGYLGEAKEDDPGAMFIVSDPPRPGAFLVHKTGTAGTTRTVTWSGDIIVKDGATLKTSAFTLSEADGDKAYEVTPGPSFKAGQKAIVTLTTSGAGTSHGTDTARFVLPALAVMVDANRDGVIDDADRDRATETDPWRFWLNDDDDSITPNEFPSAKRDYTTPKVDGSQDLRDFFPVFLDIQQLVKALPPGPSVKYTVKQAGGAANFVETNLTRENAFTYQNGLKLPDPPELATGFGTNLTQPPRRADTRQITAEGVELTATFLNNVCEHNQGVILVEGRTPTTNPLVLTVAKDGVIVTEVALPLSIGARILLLLHGMNSNTETWDDFVDQQIGHGPGQWAADIKVEERKLPTNAPMLTSHGVRCFRLQFGGYEDGNTIRKGLEDLTTKKGNNGNYLEPRSNRCGDFETFAELSQEIDDAIGLLLADPKYVNAQVFLVGHSRGGLAARGILQGQLNTPGPDSLARRAAVVGLLTTGTPHRGSPIGKIYQWLNGNNRNTHPSDWAVVDKLKEGLEKDPIEDGVDLRRPVVEDMADDSTAITSLNAAVGLLPDNIRYGQIIYKKSALGRLKRMPGDIPTYSVFNVIPGLPRFSSNVKDFLLGAGHTPDELGYLGDGLIPSENQKFPQSFLTGHEVSELVVTTDDVLHAEEPGRTTDLRNKLHDLMPTWFP